MEQIEELQENNLKRKRTIANFCYYLFMILVIVGIAWLCVFVYKHKEAYFRNPLTYWAERVGGDIQCSASCYKPNRPERTADFTFNKTAVVNIRKVSSGAWSIDELELPDISDLE